MNGKINNFYWIGLGQGPLFVFLKFMPCSVNDNLYLIMEFIQTDHIASDIQRARAISDIVSIEVPLDIGPGPIGGGRIHMRIFWNDQISDVDYPSIQDLEDHLNRVCTPEP